MKIFLLPFGILCAAASLGHAQQLPVPGGKNPDWVLEKSKMRPNAQPTDVLPGMYPMPNAMQNSIKSIGNRHYYWDSHHQFAYEWLSRSSSGSIAPDAVVTVRKGPEGTTYTFRRFRRR